MRVVVVDDEPDLREMLKVVLPLLGVDVIGEASDGAAALGEVILQRPDAVVLDLRMPGIDGWETLRLLREWSPRTRVVVYTAEPCPNVPALEAEFGAYVVRKGDGLDTLAQVLLTGVGAA